VQPPPLRVELALAQLRIARRWVGCDPEVASATAVQRYPKLPIGDAARKDLERRHVLRQVAEKFRQAHAECPGLPIMDRDARVRINLAQW
jgi:hypothetical protein